MDADGRRGATHQTTTRMENSYPGSFDRRRYSLRISSRKKRTHGERSSVVISSDADSTIRHELRAAHNASLHHIANPGPSYDAATRVEIAQVASAAYLTTNPLAPWASPSSRPELTVAYRLARHANTITQGWVNALELTSAQLTEIVGVVISVIPVVAFARAVGITLPELPRPAPGGPTGEFAPEVGHARLNWFPVAAPADQRAAVLQALSALPSEDTNLWRLAAAQYMSDVQMADPLFTRGTLSRAQMELVAGRLSKLRECFY